MATPRRRGSETSETRARILDVTERIMLDDGYAAVSSRRVAKDAGVTAALVHYYFGTIDDLFLAVLRRRVDQQLERQRRVVSSQQPFRALWEVATDPARTGLMLEFMGLANHRKVIRSELASSSEQFRKLQLELVRPHVERREIVPDEVEPLQLLVLINAIGQDIVLERSIGMNLGLAETAALVERFLDRIEPKPTTAPRARRRPVGSS